MKKDKNKTQDVFEAIEGLTSIDADDIKPKFQVKIQDKLLKIDGLRSVSNQVCTHVNTNNVLDSLGQQ